MSRRARRRAEADEARWIGLQPEPDDRTDRIEELLRQAQEQQPVGSEDEQSS